MESEVDGWGGASLASCFELWGTVWYDWCERGRLWWCSRKQPKMSLLAAPVCISVLENLQKARPDPGVGHCSCRLLNCVVARQMSRGKKAKLKACNFAG